VFEPVFDRRPPSVRNHYALRNRLRLSIFTVQRVLLDAANINTDWDKKALGLAFSHPLVRALKRVGDLAPHNCMERSRPIFSTKTL